VQYFDIIQKWFSPSNEYDAVKVTYTTAIEFIGTLKNQHVVFKIDRKNLLLNDELPEENVVTALAEKCGAVNYPLEISINVSRTDVSIIHNYSEILKRWQTLKPALYEYYDGEEIVEYINETDAMYNDEEMFTERINQDLLLSVYFKGIFKNSNIEEQMFTNTYPVLNYKKPLFFSLNEITHNAPNKIITTITGIVDKQKVEDLDTGDDSEVPTFITDGSVEIFYEYNSAYNRLEKVDAAWSVFIDGNEHNISINVTSNINVESINN
jgi:hypothetical protein